MVLNALRIDPGRVWKGPWRWYSEAMLACCVPLPEVASSGISLDAFASLARCNGAAATLVRCSSSPGDGLGSLASFRAAVRAACATPSGSFLVASYSRAALGQTGGGHFSPLAGYHEASDSVLVLDVARFKYPPHWVSLSTLHAAMLVHDPSTGRPRGWVMTARSAALPLVLLAFGNAAHTGFWPRPYESGGGSSGVGVNEGGIPLRQVCHRGSACCQVEALSVDAPPSSSGGCCQLKGRSVVGAQELLRTAAATLESSECERSVGEVVSGGYGVSTTAAALQLALDILLRGGGWHTGHQAAAAAARSGSSLAHEHVGTLLSAAAKAVSSSSSAIADWGEYRTADDDADDAAATAAAASARCWTRLSREQVLSASELLTDVARTPLHAHITALLDGGNSPAVGSSGSSGIESGNACDTPIESGNAAGGIAPPSLFSGVALFAAARGSDHHDTSGSGVGADTTTGGHIHGAACGHEVDTCVRVSTADVLTLLLLTLYGGADGDSSSVPSSATIPAALVLRQLAAASLGTASPLLRAEVALLKGQLLA